MAGTYGGLDRFGRVVDQRWKIATANTVKDQFKYAYDRASNRISREVSPDGGNPSGLDEYYLYDGLQHLMKVNRGNLSSGSITDANAGFSQAWAAWDTDHWASRLDALGNWPVFKVDTNGGGSGDSGWELNQTRLHNKVNEIDNDDNHANAPSGSISGGSWVLPVQDAAGNMTSGPKPGAETTRHSYQYDPWNRLRRVYIDTNSDGDYDDGTDTLIAEYRYDGVNRRIVKLLPNGNNWDRTDFYYNEAWQCLEERFAANQESKETVPTVAKTQWLWSVQYIDAPVVRWRDGNCDGDLTGGTGEGDNTLYYTNDANMNVTALVDASDGAVVERYSYDPYGKATVRHGVRDAAGNDTSASEWSERTSNTFANDILYCGYRFDNESGLYSVRHRYYHPTMGRWLRRDPLVYFDGPNLYLYAEADPVLGLDPWGLVEVTFHEDRNDEKTKELGDALGYTYLWAERGDLKVTANPTPVPPKKGSGFCCNIKPEATIHWGVRPGLPSEAEVVERANKENYKKIVKELKSEAASTKLGVNPSALKADVITRENAEAHERYHINQHKAVASETWKDVSKTAETTHYTTEEQCHELAQKYQKEWIQKYLKSWGAHSQQDIEAKAYQAGRKLLGETAEKIENKFKGQK
jgi:RHS repeat-associated protein